MDTLCIGLLLNSCHFFFVMIFYAGPDQILPLMSALGAILGVLLVFWQRFVAALRRAWQFLLKRRRPIVKTKV
jgi:undecaprenyl pyrophosphate phosphatase UppP